ncbi:MAG: RHS repeat-associated core domain-containing protein [Burkholderiales bacterium]|nr:RHS repeat-associated core domain-containing protein [Burkholderiales bacterium]
MYFVHTDHLNTPRLIASDTGQAVWTWNNDDPYGNNTPNENPAGAGQFTCNLRLPGQYFDSETNTHYNYFRDYDASTGRYVESDPIGLLGGLNTYAYVDGNPIQGIDHLGLTNFYQKRYQATAKAPTSFVPVDDPCVKKYIYDNYGGLGGFITEIGNLQQFLPSSNPNYLSSVQEGLIILDEKLIASKVPQAAGRALMTYGGGNLSLGYVTGSGLATFGSLASGAFEFAGAVMTPFATAAMSKARDACTCAK